MTINIWMHGSSSSPIKKDNNNKSNSPNGKATSPRRSLPTDGRAGVGIYFEDDHYQHLNLSEQVLAPKTSNTHWAELYALTRVMDAAPSSDLVINSDNKFAVKCLTRKVKYDEFEGEAPATLELIADVSKAVQQRRSEGFTIDFVHVQRPVKETREAVRLAEDAVLRASHQREVPVPYINVV